MTPHLEPLLDIRHRPDGDVVIKRYPFETVFNKDEWEELIEYCASHSTTRKDSNVLDELIDFDRWFSGRHVGGQSPIIPEVRQELHRRIEQLRQQQVGGQG